MPRTLRVDYYHSGDASQERFSLDKVVPNRVVYSRGFASIYGEWETTGEAREMWRTFHESLRFPAPSLRAGEQQAVETKLLGSERYAGKVGAFEGANYSARGYYRSQVDCILFTRNEVPFCRVCQRGIERVIDLYTRPAP